MIDRSMDSTLRGQKRHKVYIMDLICPMLGLARQSLEDGPVNPWTWRVLKVNSVLFRVPLDLYSIKRL